LRATKLLRPFSLATAFIAAFGAILTTTDVTRDLAHRSPSRAAQTNDR
jgi:hypothetical protein